MNKKEYLKTKVNLKLGDLENYYSDFYIHLFFKDSQFVSVVNDLKDINLEWADLDTLTDMIL